MKPAIHIQNLGKQYKLASSEPYIALRDVITKGFKNFLSGKKKTSEKFWALQDIDLDIMPGERVGIIGRNGAGKSTLLKIISRITPPTTGEITINGRVGSLLEVGTGFHPELTGRENIYLNGSILGLKRTEINRQLDTIIDFSGVQKFIDTPLKHYSSGMQMRLAFSVAAHLESEILLVDEVLAVGDREFQKKCLGKMEEISKSEGRTILFVSHNMDSIRKFCNTTLLLDGGHLLTKGKTESVINEYIAKHLSTKPISEWPEGVLSYDGKIKLNKVWVHDTDEKTKSLFDTTENIGISAEYEVLDNNLLYTHGINVYNQENVNIFNSHDVNTMRKNEGVKKGMYKTTVWLPGNLLPEGIFSVSFAVFLPNPLDVFIHEHNIVSFEIYTDYNYPTARGNYSEDFQGIIRPLLNWSLKPV
jgi:lipopolysaccharide transport system ATP-binding protein